jgi:hypothetical protein
MDAAITREKQIKAWKPDWKIRTIEELNTLWLDLHDVDSTLVAKAAGPLPSQGGRLKGGQG